MDTVTLTQEILDNIDSTKISLRRLIRHLKYVINFMSLYPDPERSEIYIVPQCHLHLVVCNCQAQLA